MKTTVGLMVVTVALALIASNHAQVMRICENGDCLQLARRTSLAGSEDLNGIYNLMRYLRQGKVIGTNFNSPFLGKRSMASPDKEK